MEKREEPVFDLKFSKVNDKFRQCSDENTESHPGDKIGYCHKDDILFCSYCMVGAHSSCLTQVTVHPILDNKLKDLAVKFMGVIKDKEKTLHALEKKFEIVLASINSNNKVIEDFGNLIIGTVTQLVKEYQKEQNVANDELKQEVNKSKENLNNSIANCSKIIEKCKNIASLKGDLQTLISKYEELKSLYENENNTNLIEYASIIKTFEDKRTNKIEFNKESVISQVNDKFKGIIGKGYMIGTEQSNSDYLCISNPLTTHITLFDIYHKSATIHNLFLNGKPFSIPYGSTSMIYNNLVIIAGGTINFIEYLKTCHQYSILMNDIIKCSDFLIPSSYHVMIETKGKAYILGGKDENGYLSRCEACNLKIYNWHEIAPLNEAKSGITACAYGNYIYIFGGIGFKANANANAKKVEAIRMDEPIAFGSIERLDVRSEGEKWERIADINPRGYYLGVIEGEYKGASGFYIFGGMYEKDKPMKETFFLNVKELNEYKEIQAQKIPNCNIEESEGLASRVTRWGRGVKEVWVPGKLLIHYMTFSNKSNSPKWNICNNYTHQFA